jgi:hypothetical protein
MISMVNPMPSDIESKIEIELSQKEREELVSYKFLLGEMGIAILTAIARGAHAKDAIMMLSGVPLACVVGRMPVLLNLKLVIQLGIEEVRISKRGLQFLKCINECI